MIEKRIMLKSIGDVKEFVQIATNFDGEVDLVHDRYCIDGKSIMGIFSLDLSQKITMLVNKAISEEAEAAFLDNVKKFIV